MRKNSQNKPINAHFEYFFTCHYSKTVWLAENLDQIEITHYEKLFSYIKQRFSHFLIIFTEIHRIKTKPKNNYQII